MRKNFINYTFIIFIFLINSFSIFAQKEIDFNKLEEDKKTGLIYIKENKELFTGIANKYYENGKLDTKFSYKNGVLEGEGIIYYETGEVWSNFSYSQGKLDGVIKTYYKDGSIETVKHIKNGKYNGSYKVYFQNGKLEYDANFVELKLDGLIKTYYENGKELSIENYENGKLDGEAIRYYENGNLFIKANFTNDKLNGTIKVFKEDGTLDFISFYRNGELLSGKEIDFKEAIIGDERNTTAPNMDKEYFWIVLISIIILLGIISAIKIYRTFPKTDNLTDREKNIIFNILMKYKGNHRDLHSSYKLNGFGTGFYTVRSMIIDGEKISIQAKMLSLLFIPAPITLGYLVYYDKNKILASFSNLEFGKAKEEIQKFLKDEIMTEKKENNFKCK